MSNAPSKTILLIDDEEYIRLIMEACLEGFSNWQSVSFPSCEEGLAALPKVQPDAILLDILMPNMNGLDFLKKLQVNPEFSDIPVVLLTCRVDLTEPQKIAQLGVKGAIAKPFHPLKLVAEIAQILGWQ